MSETEKFPNPDDFPDCDDLDSRSVIEDEYDGQTADFSAEVEDDD